MVDMHRSLDGAVLHRGVIERCLECSPSGEWFLFHEQDEHHVFHEQSMFGPFGSELCTCGEPETAGIHHAPPCNWCVKDGDLGPAAPWWHRVWCRFVARFGRP